MATASVFISSVQKELQAERQSIKAFVEGDPLLRRCFTAFVFEDLPASDRRADEVYLDEVERCAVYVAIFGQSHGFEDSGARPVPKAVGERPAADVQCDSYFSNGAKPDARTRSVDVRREYRAI